MSEQYYDSTVTNFETALKFLQQNNLLADFKLRCEDCMKYAEPCGYGFPDEIDQLFDEYYGWLKCLNLEGFRNLRGLKLHRPYSNLFNTYTNTWSSYLTCISVQPTHLQRDVENGWFDSVANFNAAYENKKVDINIEAWLELH